MDNKINRCNKCGAWAYGVTVCGVCAKGVKE